MKAHAALLPLVVLAFLASCNGPTSTPPAGPRGYSLDHAPRDIRYGQDPAAPTAPADTRYLDTGDPTLPPPAPNPNDPAAATVQPPDPGAPTVPATMPPGTTPPAPTGTTPPPPVVATPPTNTPETPPTPPASTGSYPTATRTKPGFVKSPFDSLGREIDVREMRSGQKARCPYTQKVFLVP
ncbi:MAG: hypothetical protein RIS79_2085 [Verrucomicrobiota bacterium]|jgi:hypothetical protein